ncbi:MAG: azurin [Leeuwenhoekiella sp.]
MKTLKHLALAILALTLVNCGDSEKKEKEQVKLKTNTSSTTSSKEDSKETEVILLATDQMQFNKSEIRVPAGKPIKLTLRHTGTMDVKVMGHNFVLLTEGTEIPAFANNAAGAAENEYIPENTDAVIVHTKLLGGGQSDTIDFEAPEPGSYDFICSFPGHYALMKGKFIVE